MPKVPSNVAVKDPTAVREFDSTSKVLDDKGRVVSEPGKARKALVEDLLVLLQNTLDDKISGVRFGAGVDSLQNRVHEIQTYAASLKEAAAAIETGYPSGEQDVPLSEIEDLCNILSEGAEAVAQHLDEIRKFSDDLGRIKAEFHGQITTLFQEV